MFAGSRSARTRNCGLVRMRRSASSMPSWKVPSRRPFLIEAQHPFHDPPAVTGRRYARRISVVRISFAHGSSWAALDGRQVKTLRMLRESSGRVGLNGPWILRSPMAG